jgi:hypothetical protein
MLPLARLEDEPKSGAIFVYLFVSATLTGIAGYIRHLLFKPCHAGYLHPAAVK